MAHRFAVICWLFVTILHPRLGAGQTQFQPLPNGWKDAKFGMSVEEVLALYPGATREKDDVDFQEKTYILSAPAKGVGRVTFFFFQNKLFKIAINFDLSRAQQTYQIYLYEKKYGPCQEKEINFQGADNTTKLVWHNQKHAIQIGQLVTAQRKEGTLPEYYLAAIYIDIACATAYEEHAKKVGAQKHKLDWDDF